MSTVWSDDITEVSSKMKEDEVICEVTFKQVKRERQCIEDVNTKKKERICDNFKHIEIESLVSKTETLLKE